MGGRLMLRQVDPDTSKRRLRGNRITARFGLTFWRCDQCQEDSRSSQRARDPDRSLLWRIRYHCRRDGRSRRALVYIAAFAPDADETTQSLQEKFPATAIFSHIEAAAGRVWLKPNGVPSFAGDLPEHEQKLVWATQAAPTADLFNQKVEGTAWRSKPSWYIIATKDQTIQPELQRFVAKRMGATIFDTDSSHVPMLSQPEFVLDVIRKAARAVMEKTES
jgi:pimeloyl-ACP methyl ester carboxylesterase